MRIWVAWRLSLLSMSVWEFDVRHACEDVVHEVWHVKLIEREWKSLYWEQTFVCLGK